ncbi:hypothetical protein B0H13DRAFT_1626017, partial [Mycena leptocephala]
QDEQEDTPKMLFGIFATQALKLGEEIVVGWEWDDANAVHWLVRSRAMEGTSCSSFCLQLLLVHVLFPLDSLRLFLHSYF